MVASSRYVHALLSHSTDCSLDVGIFACVCVSPIRCFVQKRPHSESSHFSARNAFAGAFCVLYTPKSEGVGLEREVIFRTLDYKTSTHPCPSYSVLFDR